MPIVVSPDSDNSTFCPYFVVIVDLNIIHLFSSLVFLDFSVDCDFRTGNLKCIRYYTLLIHICQKFILNAEFGNEKIKQSKNPVCKILKYGFSDIYKMVAYTRPIFLEEEQ